LRVHAFDADTPTEDPSVLINRGRTAVECP